MDHFIRFRNLCCFMLLVNISMVWKSRKIFTTRVSFYIVYCLLSEYRIGTKKNKQKISSATKPKSLTLTLIKQRMTFQRKFGKLCVSFFILQEKLRKLNRLQGKWNAKADTIHAWNNKTIKRNRHLRNEDVHRCRSRK